MPPCRNLWTAVAGATPARGHTATRAMRRCLESLPQGVYDRGYAERWSEAVCDLLEEKGLLTKA